LYFGLKQISEILLSVLRKLQEIVFERFRMNCIRTISMKEKDLSMKRSKVARANYKANYYVLHGIICIPLSKTDA